MYFSAMKRYLFFNYMEWKELHANFSLRWYFLNVLVNLNRVIQDANTILISFNTSWRKSKCMVYYNQASSVWKCMISKSVSDTRCFFMVHVRSLLDWFITSSFQGLLRRFFRSSIFSSIHTCIRIGLLFYTIYKTAVLTINEFFRTIIKLFHILFQCILV